MAEEKEQDLVEIAPQAKPPVCKIIDYGKFRYEQQKRDKLQRKNQSVSILKEIRFHPNTDIHDFEFKVKNAIITPNLVQFETYIFFNFLVFCPQ